MRCGARALTLARRGDTAQVRQIAFGASSSITANGISVRGRRAAVPLGNAAQRGAHRPGGAPHHALLPLPQGQRHRIGLRGRHDPARGQLHRRLRGLAYVSSFGTGTLVWNTRTRTFVRGLDNPVCAKLASGACRGAADATTDVQGNVYQAFFGNASAKQAPQVFVYRPGDFVLTDSISAVNGPIAVEVRSF